MKAKWIMTAFAALWTLASGVEAQAACRVQNNPYIQVSTRDNISTLFGTWRVFVSVTPPTIRGDSPSDNCSNSYTTRIYLNNQFVGYGDVLDLNTNRYPDGAYQLKAEIDFQSNVTGYYSSPSVKNIEIRNNWLRPEVWDHGAYLQYNEDVRNAFGGDPYRTVMHWMAFGAREGRQASHFFRSLDYLNNYADLRAAFGGNNYPAAIDHYLNAGINEGREGLAILAGVVQPAGFFQIQNNGGIYYSNGNDAFCGYAHWEEFVEANGSGDMRGVRLRADNPPQRYDGRCGSRIVSFDTNVHFRSTNGTYISAEGGGGSSITSNRPWAYDWERFAIRGGGGILRSGSTFAMQTMNGSYISAICGGGEGGNCGEVNTQPWILGWETFRIVKVSGSDGDIIRRGDQIAIQSSNGQYCSATGGGGEGSRLICRYPWIGSWETFRIE